VEGNESYGERKYQGTKVPWNFRSRNESSTLWNVRSRERKFLGTKVPAFASRALIWAWDTEYRYSSIETLGSGSLFRWTLFRWMLLLRTLKYLILTLTLILTRVVNSREIYFPGGKYFPGLVRDSIGFRSYRPPTVSRICRSRCCYVIIVDD